MYGAINAGMRGVWLNRHGRPPDPFGPDPDLTVATVEELATALGAG